MRVKMKYEEWLNIWLDDYVKPGAKERTYIRYEQLIRTPFPLSSILNNGICHKSFNTAQISRYV